MLYVVHAASFAKLGKIIACLRGDNLRLDNGDQAKLVGVVGMILRNDKSDGNL